MVNDEAEGRVQKEKVTTKISVHANKRKSR